MLQRRLYQGGATTPPHTPGQGQTAGQMPPTLPQRKSFLALPILATYYSPGYLKVDNKA
jgi:hypothetical protein